ncbi:MAG: haloacid dehalogenase-like hydrolase [bacterium]|nr:haloacid dehalogenase-like hydrolase [bacterium]
MKVFDFDNTLYDGESSLDFFLFCLKKKKTLVKHLPSVIYNLMRYKAGYVGIEKIYSFCDKMMNVFFENRDRADEMLGLFWAKNSKKLKPALLELVSAEDAVISASPDFLLEGIRDRLKAQTLICTRTESGRITFLCYGKNKVKAFDEYFGGRTIDAFYTDSVNDMPMMKKAVSSYIVKGSKVRKVDKVD